MDLIIELTKSAVLSDLRKPEIDDHGVFDVVIRAPIAQRYRMPWMVDTKPLSDPSFQGRFTAQQIVQLTHDRHKRARDKCRQSARKLGWRLAEPARRKKPEDARYCDCGEPLQKYQRSCEVCAFHHIPAPSLSKSIPIDCMGPFYGRAAEPSWRREDRLLRRDYEDWKDDLGEATPLMLGYITQGARDVEEIKATHACVEISRMSARPNSHSTVTISH